MKYVRILDADKNPVLEIAVPDEYEVVLSSKPVLTGTVVTETRTLHHLVPPQEPARVESAKPRKAREEPKMEKEAVPEKAPRDEEIEAVKTLREEAEDMIKKVFEELEAGGAEGEPTTPSEEGEEEKSKSEEGGGDIVSSLMSEEISTIERVSRKVERKMREEKEATEDKEKEEKAKELLTEILEFQGE